MNISVVTIGMNDIKIVAVFRGMHVSSGNIAMHVYHLTDRQTHEQKDRQTPDKVIPMCRYAWQATEKKLNCNITLIIVHIRSKF